MLVTRAFVAGQWHRVYRFDIASRQVVDVRMLVSGTGAPGRSVNASTWYTEFANAFIPKANRVARAEHKAAKASERTNRRKVQEGHGDVEEDSPQRSILSEWMKNKNCLSGHSIDNLLNLALQAIASGGSEADNGSALLVHLSVHS